MDALLPVAASADGILILFENFGIRPDLIISQSISFLLVMVLLWKFAFKPILATVDERQSKIADGLQYAEEMKDKLAEAERRQQAILREASQEAQKVAADARNSAKDHLDREMAAASKKVEDMLARGREANELERQKMLSEVRQEIARLVVQTTGQVLGQDLKEDERKRFNESAVRVLSEGRN